VGNATEQLAETHRDVIIIQVSACAETFELSLGSDRERNMNLESKIHLDGRRNGVGTLTTSELSAMIFTPAKHSAASRAGAGGCQTRCNIGDVAESADEHGSSARRGSVELRSTGFTDTKLPLLVIAPAPNFTAMIERTSMISAHRNVDSGW
jgi:hypothetical protein